MRIIDHFEHRIFKGNFKFIILFFCGYDNGLDN